MFSRYKKSSPLKNKIEYSLDHLKYLYNVLLNNQTVCDENKDLLIETLRSISELLIWGDKNDPALFDFFLEKNMLLFFISFAKQDNTAGKNLSVQILQTLNILFENIKSDTSLYYLLSNNHINTLILHEFDFTQEEVVAYYITFLKTLSMKLNQHTIHFFINEHSNEFPLYSAAIKFCKSSEPMVRIAVQTITLNIFSVNDKSSEQQISKYSTSYFYDLSSCLESNIIAISRTLKGLNESLLNIVLNHVLDDNEEALSQTKTNSPSKFAEKNDSAKSTKLITSQTNSQQVSPSHPPKTPPLTKNLALENSELVYLKRLAELNGAIKIKCVPLLKRLEDLTTDHLDKLHYIQDIFRCSARGPNQASHLNSLLSEILVNNVFVPCYLKPLSMVQTTASSNFQTLSKDFKRHPLGSIRHPSPDENQSQKAREDTSNTALSFETALFLTNLCFEVFGERKEHAPKTSSDHGDISRDIDFNRKSGPLNPILQELLDILFINTNPYQIIMYCCDVRASTDSTPSNHLSTPPPRFYQARNSSIDLSFFDINNKNYVNNSSNSTNNDKLIETSVLSSSALNTTSNHVNINQNLTSDSTLYNQIRPNDSFSKSYLTEGGQQSIYTISKPHLDRKSSSHNANPLFENIINNLRLESKLSHDENIATSWACGDGKILLVLLFLTTIFSDTDVFQCVTSPTSTTNTDVPLDLKLKDNQTPGISYNVELIITCLLYLLSDIFNRPQNLFGVRLLCVNLALSLLSTIFSRLVITREVNEQLSLLKTQSSTLSENNSENHVKYDSTKNAKIIANQELQILHKCFAQLLPLYERLIEQMLTKFRTDEEIFIDTFENELASFAPASFLFPYMTQSHESPLNSPATHLKVLPSPETSNAHGSNIISHNNSYQSLFDCKTLTQNPLLITGLTALNDETTLPYRVNSQDLSSIDFYGLHSANILLLASDVFRESAKYVKLPQITNVNKSNNSKNSNSTDPATCERLITHYLQYHIYQIYPPPILQSLANQSNINNYNNNNSSSMNDMPDAIGPKLGTDYTHLNQKIATIFMAQNFFCTLSQQFHPTSCKLLDEKWSFAKYLRDYSLTCNLPDVSTVLDLSDKDIISCSLDKCLNRNLPYWFLVVSDFYFALVVPHQKKMAHGIIMYIGPLKDIEIANVYNEPKCLYVRTQNSLSHTLYDKPLSSPTVGSPSLSSITGDLARLLDRRIKGFKAKLIFEDTIRCQAARNCLLKGRARCRKIKSKFMSKILYAAQVSFLPLPHYYLHTHATTRKTIASRDRFSLTSHNNMAHPPSQDASIRLSLQDPSIKLNNLKDNTSNAKTINYSFRELNSHYGFRNPQENECVNNQAAGTKNSYIHLNNLNDNSASPENIATSLNNITKHINNANTQSSFDESVNHPIENIPLTHKYLGSPPRSNLAEPSSMSTKSARTLPKVPYKDMKR